MSVPPVLPVPILLLFVFVYIPTLLLSILFVRSSENVMKNTPRKSTLVRKPREESRFIQYLFARSGYVALSVACIGWLTEAGSGLSADRTSTNGMSIEKWANRLGSFESVLEDDKFTSKTIAEYYHVQDVMSIQMLLGIIFQLMTMLARGQDLTDIIELMSESLFLIGSIGVTVVHILVLLIRFNNCYVNQSFIVQSINGVVLLVC